MSDDPDPVGPWCARLASTLGETAARFGAIVGWVGEDWSDARGREWAERATLLHRDLQLHAATATQLDERLVRAQLRPSDDPVAVVEAALGAAAALAARSRGVRLGGTEGARTDQDRGMRIAELGGDSSG